MWLLTSLCNRYKKRTEKKTTRSLFSEDQKQNRIELNIQKHHSD